MLARHANQQERVAVNGCAPPGRRSSGSSLPPLVGGPKAPAPEPAKPGRPTKLTPELIVRICNWIRMGNPVLAACLGCGITRKTFYNWTAEARQPCTVCAKSGSVLVHGKAEDCPNCLGLGHGSAPIYAEFLLAVDQTMSEFRLTHVANLHAAAAPRMGPHGVMEPGDPKWSAYMLEHVLPDWGKSTFDASAPAGGIAGLLGSGASEGGDGKASQGMVIYVPGKGPMDNAVLDEQATEHDGEGAEEAPEE